MRGPYQLIDFGHGRKLESLAGRLIDRPSPAAEQATPRSPQLWRDAESHFDLDSKQWIHRTPWPAELSVEVLFPGKSPGYETEEKNAAAQPLIQPKLSLPVQPTPFGHIGIFPEQSDNWRWLSETTPANPTAGTTSRRVTSVRQQALNLFGYTGASTMSMAQAGMSVAHVDAAKPNVEAAKRVAAANGLEEAPIRYLVDDAAAFVKREIRRGNRYHTIVMDPPAYGHGPKSKRAPRQKSTDGDEKRPSRQAKAWRIQRDLPELLKDCFDLISGHSFRILVTGHSAEMNQRDVLEILQRKLTNRRIGRMDPKFESGRMSINDKTGRRLDAGFFVRCEGQRG